VGGVIGPLNAPEALLLGLPDEHGRLRVAGRTGPLTLPARRELGALLVPPRQAHPWPLPPSRFGQLLIRRPSVSWVDGRAAARPAAT
jgi:hypothetical protein